MEKSASVARGPGFFGGAVVEKFPYLAVEDDRRLLNPRIQGHFLTKLFVVAGFRSIRNSGSMRELVRFQSENKLLLTAYSQKELRVLGRIVANRERRPLEELLGAYETHLHFAFRRSPNVGSNVNVLLKCMGIFSRQLSSKEKAFFRDSLEKYKTGRLPLRVCTGVLKAWITRLQQEYLASQTFLEPYPEELAAVDTGIARLRRRARKLSQRRTLFAR
jgi:uncharacterized protein YbgA (DUF1722 family)